MLADIQFGQKVQFNARTFRVITIVPQELVCLESLEPQDGGIWIVNYGKLMQEGRIAS